VVRQCMRRAGKVIAGTVVGSWLHSKKKPFNSHASLVALEDAHEGTPFLFPLPHSLPCGNSPRASYLGARVVRGFELSGVHLSPTVSSLSFLLFCCVSCLYRKCCRVSY